MFGVLTLYVEWSEKCVDVRRALTFCSQEILNGSDEDHLPCDRTCKGTHIRRVQELQQGRPHSRQKIPGIKLEVETREFGQPANFCMEPCGRLLQVRCHLCP